MEEKKNKKIQKDEEINVPAMQVSVGIVFAVIFMSVFTALLALGWIK